jgi:hypothetical protein
MRKVANEMCSQGTHAMVTARLTIAASILMLALVISSPALSQGITLAIGQADTSATASTKAQTWPGCSSNCLPNNPAYVILPGSARRVWTNVCLGTNTWGGTALPTAPACPYPVDTSVNWTINSGNCTMSPATRSIAFSTLSAPASDSTELCSITATTNATPSASVTFHVLVVKPAADSLKNSASTALHYCGSSGVATCVHVLPFYEVLYRGQYADLQADVTGNTNMGVSWGVSPNNGGLQIVNGSSNRDLALKGVASGTYTITATSNADNTAVGTAMIIVTENFIAAQMRTSKVIPVDCTAVGSGTTYEVSDSSSFSVVPWSTLRAGDTVRIHAGTYPIPFQLSTSGTPTQPIRVCGVPDASGNLPTVTGNGAGPGNVSSPEQPYGLVVVRNGGFQHVNCSASPTQCSQPPEPDPHSIIIEGLKVQSAHANYRRTGGAAAWAVGAGSFRIQGRDIVIRGCEVTDSSNGIFAFSQHDLLETETVRRLTVEGNSIYGNGEVGGYSQHNNYLQGDELLFQWNWVGVVRSGAAGGSVKIRMPYAVVRYNYIQGSARLLDMVEVQDWYDMAIPQQYYADNFPTSFPEDPTSIADIASVAEHIQKDYVYGNILDNNDSYGTSSEFPIHNFPDVFAGREKGGTLYLYNNTDREVHDLNGTGTGAVFLIDSSRIGPLPQVWPQTQMTNNVIDLECATVGCGNGMALFSFTVAYQDMLTLDVNWITSGWDKTRYGTGPNAGADFPSPSNGGSTCYQTSCSGPNNHIVGLTNLISGSTVPFDSASFVPLSNSQLIGTASPLPTAVRDMPPEFVYRPDTQQVAQRFDLVSNSPTILGALDSGQGSPLNPANRPAAPVNLHITGVH